MELNANSVVRAKNIWPLSPKERNDYLHITPQLLMRNIPSNSL